MASIKVRGNKLTLRYYNKLTGKKVDRALHLPNTKEGLRIAKEQKKLFEANILDKYYSTNRIIKNRLSFDEAAQIFSEVKKHSDGTITIIALAIKHLKEATKKNYVTDLDRMDFRKLSLYLSKYMSKKGKPLSANSKSIYSRSLRNFFGWLKEEKYVNDNFVIIEKGEKKQVEIIPDIVFSKIKDYLCNQNKNGFYFVRMLELTGLRKSSALNMAWEQVNYEQKNLCVKNVKKNRDFIFPLTDEIISLLKEIGIKETGKIFQYSSDNLAFWYRAQRELKIEKVYGLHQIRKSFISKLVNDGMAISDVATLADHKSMQTTQQYYVKTNIDRLRSLLNKNSAPKIAPQDGNN
jgi:site-specific recombinase XerD